MARISDELINRLKTEVDLCRLVASQGFALKNHGADDKVICCPFHNDKTASCVISPQSNLFHCFGCNEGGSVIDWVMKTQGVSFRLAVEILQKDTILNESSFLAADLVTNSTGNNATQTTPKSVKYNTTPKLPSPVSANADLQQLLHQVIDYYHDTLKQSPEALAYLQQRGLNHPELINTFKLGFANRTLGYRLPQKNRQAGAEIRSKLQQIGLLRQSGHEHFNGSIVIPIFSGTASQKNNEKSDEIENITEVYGRKLLNNLRKGTPKHTYLPGAHSGVWNSFSLAASDEVILCESLIDAMTFWVNGFKNVTASFGTNGFTEEHLHLFKTCQLKSVLIAYDNDESGNTAAQKLSKKLTAEGFNCYRVVFPNNMDANEYALQGCSRVAGDRTSGATALPVTPAVKSLGLVIRQAQWLGNGAAPKRAVNAPVNDNLKTPITSENTDEFIDKSTGEIISLAAESIAETTPEPEPAQQASPLPPSPEPLSVQHNEQTDEYLISLGELTYRLRGLLNKAGKSNTVEQLKINLLVRNQDTQKTAFHVDNLDLYASRARYHFIKQASLELSVAEITLKHDLGQLLLFCEHTQNQQLEQQAQQKHAEQQGEVVVLPEAERQAALELLKSPELLNRILADFNTCGVVGENTNKLMGYLAVTSRKLDNPLAIMIQSSSAAGKSSLMEAILQFMPDEQQIKFSAMTGQSLFYMGETNLKHKILAISEEEGAAQASYALKLLQSEGEVTIASTGKNAATGNLETQQYKVEGPVMLMMTTTAIDIDEELLNRCLVLTVNESRAQTKAIQNSQRYSQTLQGLLQKKDKQQLIQRHQNAQRLLRPLLVANPYAEQLTFLSDQTRTRRDHMKYLTLIRTITLLHQHQRPIKRITHNNQQLEYIEVTPQDIDTANRLAHEVLGRSLDELPPQTRKLLTLVYDMVQQQCRAEQLKQQDYRFSRKQVRNFTGWGNTQLKIHLMRLEDMEYLLIHKGGRGQSIVYELLYQPSKSTVNNPRFVQGLIEVEQLTTQEHTQATNQATNQATTQENHSDNNPNYHYDNKKSGQTSNLSAASRPQVGGVSGSCRPSENQQPQGLAPDLSKTDEKALIAANKISLEGSHRNVSEQAISSLAAN